MSDKPQNDLLLRACKLEATSRVPIWIMRQAGRYLPEYQAVRAKADFLTMCRTPELAAEVTLQPVDIIGVDAAIIFSDILVIPEAMGMALNFHEGRGPVFEAPLRAEKDVSQLRAINAEEDLSYMTDALKLVKKELAGRVPLIGFAGAPWTLAAYMVEGHGSKEFENIKGMRYREPALLHQLLGRLADSVADFLSAQIDAGAEVVQLFDSWAGILTPRDFREFSMPYITRVVEQVRQKGAPIIVFARNAAHSFSQLSHSGANALGVSWSEDLGEATEIVEGRVALQGNLDPCALFGPIDAIRTEVVRILNEGPKVGHIFNLGHGILPQTPVPNAKALVEIVKEESEKITSNR